MLVSVFTPTHDSTYLREAWVSLQQQTQVPWQWVLVPNGNPAPEIPEEIRNDPRVKLVPGPASDRIGELKAFACQQADGDVFVELDHDDVLMPRILGQVADAVTAGAGFVYSDAASFDNLDLFSRGYATSFGWEHYPVTAWDKTFEATRCFPLSPRMLCEVYYAPDHIRAWERQTYFKAGMHDAALSVCDDHDLICRTYVIGAKFHHIDGCGYLYRRHRENTVGKRGQQIKDQSKANKHKYLYQLVAEWRRREGHAAFNLADALVRGWQYHHPLPINGPVGSIFLPDILQFVPPDRQAPLLNECYAALVPGGWVHIMVPHEDGRYASQNPFHRVRFNENSFLYYSDRQFAANMPGVNCRFDLAVNDPFFPDANYEKHNMLVLRADLCALKGQKNPGPDRI
jgi:hypothetical protein